MNNNLSQLIEFIRALRKTWPITVRNPGYFTGIVSTHMAGAIGKENRNDFFSRVFGRDITSSKQLTAEEAFALAMFAKPKPEGRKQYIYSPEFVTALKILAVFYSQGVLNDVLAYSLNGQTVATAAWVFSSEHTAQEQQ